MVIESDQHHVHLDVIIDGGTLTGSVSADGGEPQVFHGRLGLITAIDHAIDPGRQPAATTPETTGPQ